MATNSKIEWTNHTWNPWTGCIKVSEGCKNCYAESMWNRWGKDFKQIKPTERATFYKPPTYKEPALIFTCSLSDFFIEEADGWRSLAWDIIRRTPHLTYQILTKRPERIADHLPEDWGEGWDNVWLGTSVENQEVLPRMQELMRVPAKVRFLSVEPLLSPVLLGLDGKMGFIWEDTQETKYMTFTPVNELIHWVIIGGESGPASGRTKARECNPLWMESIVDECKANEIPVFVKQMGSVYARQHKMTKPDGSRDMKGGNIEQFPEVLQVRDMPKAWGVLA